MRIDLLQRMPSDLVKKLKNYLPATGSRSGDVDQIKTKISHKSVEVKRESSEADQQKLSMRLPVEVQAVETF